MSRTFGPKTHAMLAACANPIIILQYLQAVSIGARAGQKP
jgi:hypothetical protein